MNWISVEMKKCLISKGSIFLLISCFSLGAQASTISSNWYFVLPKSTAAQKALLMKGTYKWVQESLSVSAEIPTVFQGVDADIGYEVKSFAPSINGSWAMNLAIPSLVFKAGSFNMNGTIERVVAGTKVRVNVRATCSGVQAIAQRPFNVQVNGEFKNSPFGVNLTNVVWSEDPALWKLSATECKGPANFLPFVNEAINNYWKDSASFRQNFQAELNREVNEWIANNSAMHSEFKDLNANLTLKATTFQENGANWVFRLDSKINTEKRCVFAESGVVADVAIPASTVPTIVVPDAIVTKWAQCMHEMNMFKRTDDSSKTAFQTSLMESSLAKSAVWPDLERYPSTTKFDINTSSLGSWNMTPSTDPTSMNYRIQTGILTQFVLRNRQEKYVKFWGTFDGQVNLSKVGENIVMKLSNTPTVAMKYKFDMVNSAITDKTIDVNRLRDEMLTSMKTEQMTFAIPTYEFSQAGVFHATGMSRGGGAVLFAVDFTKSK